MIQEHCFSEDWLGSFKNRKEHNRIDLTILEKMIYALHLLEHLKFNGLDFIFKGGTSLLLLIEGENRFSIDIDIICNTNRQDLDAKLKKVIESSRFTAFELDEKRSYKPGVPKARYRFLFDTVRTHSGVILLDILIEDSVYPEISEKAIKTKWVETLGDTIINVPSIDAITGDKLTAFAPNTIGIPYFKGKDRQPCAMEICKQLFDLGKLFEKNQNFEVVAESYKAFANREIEYRKNKNPDFVLTWKQSLQDTIDTCLILLKRDKGTSDEREKFRELQIGIKAFGTGFLMSGNFRIDDAEKVASRIAYVSVKLMVNDLSPIQFFKNQNIQELNIIKADWIFLNRLKRQPDKSSFYYWYLAEQLLR